MKVELAFDVNRVRHITWQAPFPKETICPKCEGICRMAFVAHEKDEKIISKRGKYVSQIHDNEGKGGYWPHDSCCVAVYFCEDCFAPTALMTQA